MEGRKSLKVEGSVEGEKLRVEAPGGGGVLLYIGYTSKCRWKGYGFQAI